MKISLLEFLVAISILSILIAFLAVAVGRVRNKAECTSCHQNIRSVGLATLDFESSIGNLPLAVELGIDEKAWHSWRTRIEWRLEASPTYYDFKQPWNSNKNLRLVNGTPINVHLRGRPSKPIAFETAHPRYMCSANEKSALNKSQVSYLAIVGEETAFPPDRGAKLSEFTDGTSNTILFVESLNSGIKWTEPRDLEFATMSFKINDRTKPSISSRHPGGANAVFADGTVSFITEAITTEELKALITKAGGEKITRQLLLDRGVLK